MRRAPHQQRGPGDRPMAAACRHPSRTRSRRRRPCHRRHGAGRVRRPVLQPGLAGEFRRARSPAAETPRRARARRSAAHRPRPAGPAAATSSGETSPSASTGNARPAAAGSATARARPCRARSRASPQAGMCGTSNVAAGSAAVVRATHRIASTPQPIGTSASRSSPSGISSSADAAGRHDPERRQRHGDHVGERRNRAGCGRNDRRRTARTRCRPAALVSASAARCEREAPLPAAVAVQRAQRAAAAPRSRRSAPARRRSSSGRRRRAPPAARAASARRPRAPGRAAKSPAARPAPPRVNRHAMAKLRMIGTCMPVSTM